MPDAIEAAIYYVVAEAITNVAKYAHATQANVAVERSNGIATVVVSDDGVGGAQPGAGSGLVGLTDRVEALGGRLHLESPPGRGTRLSAEIPCGCRDAFRVVETYRTSRPLGRTMSQRPPYSETFWQRIWPGLRSPT